MRFMRKIKITFNKYGNQGRMAFRVTSYTRGLWAELYAILALFLRGYRILAWRYKTSVGEVDIIAQRRGVIAFVEVKLRPDLDSGLEAVLPRAQHRISRAASHFITHHPKYEGASLRFDVIAVSGWRLRHLDNAWHCPT